MPEVHVVQDDKSLFHLVESFRTGPPLATRVPTRIRRNDGRRDRIGEGAKEVRENASAKKRERDVVVVVGVRSCKLFNFCGVADDTGRYNNGSLMRF